MLAVVERNKIIKTYDFWITTIGIEILDVLDFFMLPYNYSMISTTKWGTDLCQKMRHENQFQQKNP